MIDYFFHGGEGGGIHIVKLNVRRGNLLYSVKGESMELLVFVFPLIILPPPNFFYLLVAIRALPFFFRQAKISLFVAVLSCTILISKLNDLTENSFHSTPFFFHCDYRTIFTIRINLLNEWIAISLTERVMIISWKLWTTSMRKLCTQECQQH